MLQLKTENLRTFSQRVRSDWLAALCDVTDIAHMTESYLDVRTAVDEARAAFVAECRRSRVPVDEYEFNTSIANALFNTGFHRDRQGVVHRLGDLISLDHPRLGEEQGRPCIRFSIAARIEDGSYATSRETLEWLDERRHVVNEGRYVDRHPEAFVETARTLDAYMTDIEKVVTAKLERVLALVKKEAA